MNNRRENVSAILEGLNQKVNEGIGNWVSSDKEREFKDIEDFLNKRGYSIDISRRGSFPEIRKKSGDEDWKIDCVSSSKSKTGYEFLYLDDSIPEYLRGSRDFCGSSDMVKRMVKDKERALKNKVSKAEDNLKEAENRAKRDLEDAQKELAEFNKNLKDYNEKVEILDYLNKIHFTDFIWGKES